MKSQTKPLEQEDPGDYEKSAQSEMDQQPVVVRHNYQAADKLKGKAALITGGDSGIGRSIAVLYAKEGADVAIVYNDPHETPDAEETRRLIEAEGRRCEVIRGDIGDPKFCEDVIARIVKAFGRFDILVNNAAEQHPKDSIDEISPEQLERTFRTNIFSMFYLASAALKQLKKNKGCIINTTSVTAYQGNPTLLDYSSTKGAIVAFTYSLGTNLAKDGVRVNAVAPGPIWTPLIPSTFPKEKVKTFGKNVPMGRVGQPWEVAGAYVFLASDDATYISSQVIHVNGGKAVNG